MTAPELSTEQRQEAYQRSLELRQQRAAVKAFLTREASYQAFMYTLTLPVVQGMKVRSLLMALPAVGTKRANSILKLSGLAADKTVRSCGDRQLERLLAQVKRRLG